MLLDSVSLYLLHRTQRTLWAPEYAWHGNSHCFNCYLESLDLVGYCTLLFLYYLKRDRFTFSRAKLTGNIKWSANISIRDFQMLTKLLLVILRQRLIHTSFPAVRNLRNSTDTDTGPDIVQMTNCFTNPAGLSPINWSTGNR